MTQTLCTLDVMLQGRLGDFSLHKKNPFWGIQQPAGSPNSPTKLVVWSFCAQSTVPPLYSSLLYMEVGTQVSFYRAIEQNDETTERL